MKQNNVSRLIGLSGLVMTSVLSTGALAEISPSTTTDTSADALGLSDYRHFVIYPRLEKALQAQKNNDEKTALHEFEYIHQQVPDNVPLTLYLAEAYRHFGHDERARQLLTAQLKRKPGDARLQRNLDAIPVQVKPVNTVAELLAQQKACDASPTARCRSEVGQNAIRLAQLPVARQQLEDRSFAATPQGKALRNDVLQRAIYLKQWALAESLFTPSQSGLSDAERRQWFDVIMAGHLDDRMQALQSQGIFATPAETMAYATSLAERGETSRLQRYLASHHPVFGHAEQEKSWLYLLARYSAQPTRALASYNAQFAENRQYLAGATLPALMKAGDYAAAQKRLDQLPADEMLDERYAISQATQNHAETLRLARLIYARNPADLKRLDQLSWQLMQAGQSREATGLLLQRYPFYGDAQTSRTLMIRLSGLLRAHPAWATPAQMARLLQPLPSVELRQLQAQLPGLAENCQAVRQLLGDMSASYNADAWNMLAQCYRDDAPGMALYAFQQAERRKPDVWQHRAVAYQAFQVQDYATALQAWKTLRVSEMSDEDLLAATNTAQAAGDGEARDRWLDEQQKRGMDNTAQYWWLHAQRYIPAQPTLALADLTRSIQIAPTASVWAARAAVYRQLGNAPAAVSDLRNALVMEPNNSATQAALGYALWDTGDNAQSREMLEKAHQAQPDDPALIQQLAYVNQRLDDVPRTQYYARQVIDDLENQGQVDPLTAEQNQQHFNFRRLHEDVARRWSVNFDSSVGLRSGATSSANNNLGGAAPGKSYRSYGQLEAEYRIGRNMLLDGDLLSVYSRVFADTGESGVVLPVKNPMSGTGLRWKPLRDYVFFLAAEQQFPLDRHHGESDTLLRASASFFNSGKYSDEWHPNGQGWFAQNLYLDAAHYVRQDIQAWTADYRVSWHQKVAHGQTVEPYAHVQDNGYRDQQTQGAQLGGIGVRWNIWTGETHYDAWPHKVSLGVEYQHTFRTVNQTTGDRNNAFLTIGVHW